jgi:hypothetical protein
MPIARGSFLMKIRNNRNIHNRKLPTCSEHCGASNAMAKWIAIVRRTPPNRRANPRRRTGHRGRRPTGDRLLPRAQLGGRGEPRRLMAVWEQMQPHRDAMPVDHQPQTVAAPPLPPDLAAQAALLRDRLAAECDGAMATAWAAAERLGGEVAAARAAAEVARLAQAEADARAA